MKEFYVLDLKGLTLSWYHFLINVISLIYIYKVNLVTPWKNLRKLSRYNEEKDEATNLFSLILKGATSICQNNHTQE